MFWEELCHMCDSARCGLHGVEPYGATNADCRCDVTVSIAGKVSGKKLTTQPMTNPVYAVSASQRFYFSNRCRYIVQDDVIEIESREIWAGFRVFVATVVQDKNIEAVFVKVSHQ
jgi:hypothetical protein